jgi:hypothetical protein
MAPTFTYRSLARAGAQVFPPARSDAHADARRGLHRRGADSLALPGTLALLLIVGVADAHLATVAKGLTAAKA